MPAGKGVRKQGLTLATGLPTPFIMVGDDSDGEEVDLLIRALIARRPAHTSGPSSAGPAQSPFAQMAAPQTTYRAGRKLPDASILLSPRRGPGAWKRLRGALASAIALLRLPEVNHFLDTSGHVIGVRMWVALGALNAGALAYWPYPKTYLVGLVSYLMSLGLALAAGVWGARLSWDERLGGAHTIALGTVAWTIALGAGVTLPLI